MEPNEKSTWDNIRDRKNNADGLWVDWSSLHTQGQELYRVKKYEDALRCFNLVIKEDPYTPLVVRDNRAATYIKLGNFPAALDDGRKMIQLDESNCIVGLTSLNENYVF
ncbi:hypothetical protein OEA41_007035 [Lepraria neglecta]|uniref:Uncharacterized protein n=1 Tax=Lepraria neglecta TaxID=209136 RepID=A0AAD9Z9U5_9LECA|nr:hypothetical protein OEA41_007035 [Lepraria neglecta]